MTKIEICAVGLNSALKAENASAHRIELCENLESGGLTPSYGLLRKVKSMVSIPVHVLIRPRRGDYIYDNHLIDVMVEDILMVKSLGFEGVVIGVLDKDGNLDESRFKVLVEAAEGVSITFHRAIDVSSNSMKLLDRLIAHKVDRVLTSGGKLTAWEGKETIAEMQEKFGSHIKIMAGSGIHSGNIVDLIHQTGVNEVHLSAKTTLYSEMNHDSIAYNECSAQLFEDDWWYESDETEIRKVMKLLK
ncbi:MAG: copper homeostasis protein CutC [Bacteroidetes bacterium HGW-Bacteroidetes-1]|jgi:copper homeostasis protein|nr:MAG: copper homeostasis protein CutC [Bacteroidetes bacterium HGW-Bacteroidetes-1]